LLFLLLQILNLIIEYYNDVLAVVDGGMGGQVKMTSHKAIML
jgi:hypothetical protein